MDKVLDFGGSSRDGTLSAFRRVLAHRDSRILVLKESEGDLTYVEFQGSLEAAIASLVAGTVTSIHAEARGGESFLAGIEQPGSETGHHTDWYAWAEGKTLDAQPLFSELQRVEKLGFVALAIEEHPDYGSEHVTVENFPWTDWRLFAGAVRTDDGSWVVQRGPT